MTCRCGDCLVQETMQDGCRALGVWAVESCSAATLPSHSHAIITPSQVVYDFVDSLDSEAVPLRYTLATTFPRREFGSSDLSQTLHELGLTPQAALLLQPLL